MLDHVREGTERRQVFVIEGTDSRDGKPAQVDAEEDHQQKGEPECRHGEADEDKHGRDFVEEGIPADGGGNSDGKGDNDDEAEGRALMMMVIGILSSILSATGRPSGEKEFPRSRTTSFFKPG